LSIFHSSVNAVRCAIEIQNKLKAPIEVPVRIGIDVGDIVIESGNILGDAVNLASRIESFSIPGAVLISAAVYSQVNNQPQFFFKSLGKFDFKNVPKPVEIYALSNEGIVVPDQSELQGKGQVHTDSKDYLPKVFTSFLGRNKEINEIKELLPKNRLITLTGPGGTGKTRLSIQVASEVEDDFPGGIFWVPLTSVKDTNTVVTAIAEHLGLKEDPILSIEEVLIQFFKEKHALLVLDNFEHIVSASFIIDRLLKVCSKLSVMVSSRIILQVPGEMEYQVPPLNVPKLDLSNTLEDLKAMPSIALFTERAQASRPNFQLTQENAETIAEICVRLDGLPLGIELAAARMKIFSSKSLLSRLSKTFDILKGGGQFPARHQTMRNTIAWSYDLLEPQEQKLLCQVSVFVGGFTMEAIEIICGEIEGLDWDVVDGIMALVDKSLLRTEESEEDLRFYMLETIREFAFEELEKAQNEQSIKESFINYFLQLSEEASPHFFGSKAEVWSPVIYGELANLRAAIDYSIELNEMALAYRLGQALMPFWVFRGMNANEAVQQLEKIASIPIPDSLSEERYKILLHLARFYYYTPYASKATPIFALSSSYERRAMAEYGLGNLDKAKSNINKAMQILSDTFGFFRDIAMANHALIAQGMNDYDLMKSICVKLLAYDMEQGNYSSFLPGIEFSAIAAVRDGNYEIAAQFYFNSQTIRADLSTPIKRSNEKLFQDLERDLKENLSDKQFTMAQNNLMDKQQLLNLAKQVIQVS